MDNNNRVQQYTEYISCREKNCRNIPTVLNVTSILK